MRRLPLSETRLLTALCFLATFFRLYRLDTLPPGFQFDQAFYVFDVLYLLQGQFHIFFTAPGLSEPLYQYLLIPAIALFGGDTSLGLKVTGAIIGTLTIPVIYGFTRTFFRSMLHALFAALFAALSFWHIFYNRYGERIPLTVLFATLALWFLWRALAKLQMRDFLFAGLFCGICLYTYPSSRVLPLIIIVATLLRALGDRARGHQYLRGLGLTLALVLLVFLPLGVYYLARPDDFIAHTAQVSIFVPHGNVQDSIPQLLWGNALKIAGMFFIAGDPGVLRNLPGRPIFDSLQAILFIAGVVVWFGALARPRAECANFDRAVFLGVWLAAGMGLSLVSDDAPNFGRILIAMPAIMILPAWGAAEMWKRARSPHARRAVLAGLGIVLLAGTWNVYRDYFVVFANAPDTYYAFDADKVETARWLNSQAPKHHIYLAPLLSTNGTISLLTRNAPLKSFDSRDTIVLPSNASGKDALFVFPWEQDKRVQTLQARLNGLGRREEVRGSNGGVLLLNVRVPASNLPAAPDPLALLNRAGGLLAPQKVTRAKWSDPIELLGYALEADDAPRRNLSVTLYLQALNKIAQDYTFSVKARDAQDRVWGQEDKWAGTNSYATTRWDAGDVVIETFYPGLNACAPAGDYRITVEAYTVGAALAVAQLADGSGNIVWLGTTRAEASRGNRLEDLEPDKRQDVQITKNLALFGYTLTPEQPRAGGKFSLALFWRGSAGAGAEPLTISIRDSGNQEIPLAQTAIALPPEGRGLCSFFDLTLPQRAAPGNAELRVNQTPITTLTINQ